MSDDTLERVKALIRKRKNVLIEGPAGTGKSTLLRQLREEYRDSCVVVAPTGIASLNVQGQTIHSAFRLPLGYMDASTIGNLSEYLVYFYKTIRLLIVDEISMVRSDVLDAIDITLRTARQDMNPFGGVRVVFFGDTGQLPPVVTESESQFFSDHNHLFYNSTVFKNGQFETVFLTKIYRQSDPQFIEFLNSVRAGTTTQEAIDSFHTRITISPNIPYENSVVLCSTRAMADKINKIKFNQLDERPFTYYATVDNFKANEYPTNEELQLKLGAKVMFLNNDIEKRWVNGTVGYVTNISKTDIFVSVDEDEYEVPIHTWEKFSYKVKGGEIQREVVGRFKQYPLKLAWGATIHKAQGLTLDQMHLDLSHKLFEVGQLYVALSRARTLEGLSISRPLTLSDIVPNPYLLGPSGVEV